MDTSRLLEFNGGVRSESPSAGARRYAMTNDKRINVGCGASPTEGWLNFDNSWSVLLGRLPVVAKRLHDLGLVSTERLSFIEVSHRGKVAWADSRKRIPIASASASVVYSSHMLEHLDGEEARSFLREALRVLKSNGILRIVVPDLRLLVDTYLTDGDSDSFVRRTHLASPRAKGLRGLVRSVLVGPRHHAWMYDGSALAKVISECGFVDPRILPPGKTTIPDPGSLNLREREDESLYVEARKP
jgi:SAM-dependent methyltransferase